MNGQLAPLLYGGAFFSFVIIQLMLKLASKAFYSLALLQTGWVCIELLGYWYGGLMFFSITFMLYFGWLLQEI